MHIIITENMHTHVIWHKRNGRWAHQIKFYTPIFHHRTFILSIYVDTLEYYLVQLKENISNQAFDTNYIFTSFYRIQGRWKILQKWEEITHILILPDQLSIDWMITMTMWWRYNMLTWKKFQILSQYSLPLLKMI